MHGVHVVGGSNPLAPTNEKKESTMKEKVTNLAYKEPVAHGETVTGLALVMCILAALFYCYEYYLRVAPSVMSAELKQAFNLSDAGFGHLAAFYYYAYTPLQIPVGMLMDRLGPRIILTFACFLCVVGTFIFSSTEILLLAQIGRFLVGFGSAFAFVGVMKITDVWLPSKYFALMAGIATTLGLFGAISGVMAMSYMVTTMGYELTLFYAGLFGVVLTLALWLVLRDKKTHLGQKVTGANLDVVWKGLFDMIKSPNMWITGLIGCFTFLPISTFAELWAVPFLESSGYTKHHAALGSSVIFLGFAVGGPLWGILSDYMRSRRIPLIIGSFLAAIFLFLAIRLPHLSQFNMYTLLFLSSFAASVEILVFAVAVDFTKPSVSATAVAFTNMVVMLGGAVLPPVIGKLLDNTLLINNGLQSLHSVDAFRTPLMILPATLILAGILSYYLLESFDHNLRHPDHI